MELSRALPGSLFLNQYRSAPGGPPVADGPRPGIAPSPPSRPNPAPGGPCQRRAPSSPGKGPPTRGALTLTKRQIHSSSLVVLTKNGLLRVVIYPLGTTSWGGEPARRTLRRAPFGSSPRALSRMLSRHSPGRSPDYLPLHHAASLLSLATSEQKYIPAACKLPRPPRTHSPPRRASQDPPPVQAPYNPPAAEHSGATHWAPP